MFQSNRRVTPARASGGSARFRRAAFSLVEVMAASCVLMVGLGGTVLAVKNSLQTISHARYLGAASQVMQSELERLRLRNWSQLQAIQDSGDNTVPIAGVPSGSNLSCSRQIRDLRDGLKEITVEARWGGSSNRVHTARLVTRYARNGLNDYFYTSH